MRTQRFVAALLALAAVPLIARAANVQITSSTQYLRGADFLSEDEDQANVAQYLRLSATFGEAQNIDVRAYGRIVGQLTDGVAPRNQLADDVTGRLYYLYLDYRNLVPERLDLRAGRTFVGTSALPAVVDGAQLHGRDLVVKGVGATVFGGRRVFLDDRSELPFDNDTIWGGSIYLETVKRTRAEVSYAREYREGDLARDETAIDVTTTPLEAVNLFGRAKYDTVSSRFNELSVGAKVSPFQSLVLRGEFFDSTPTFERFSFYRFFGVEHYRQLSMGAEYQIVPWMRLFASYGFERFDADESANVVGGGVRLRPLPALFVNASYEHRDGYAGRLGGLRLNAGYTLMKRATLLAGVDYDDFRRQGAREGNARKDWLGLELAVNRKLSAVLRAERNENFLFNHNYQGFVAVDYHP